VEQGDGVGHSAVGLRPRKGGFNLGMVTFLLLRSVRPVGTEGPPFTDPAHAGRGY
jgi:hypothetical protein